MLCLELERFLPLQRVSITISPAWLLPSRLNWLTLKIVPSWVFLRYRNSSLVTAYDWVSGRKKSHVLPEPLFYQLFQHYVMHYLEAANKLVLGLMADHHHHHHHHLQGNFFHLPVQPLWQLFSFIFLMQQLTFPFPFVHHQSHDWPRN